jgi:hypothetical protein
MMGTAAAAVSGGVDNNNNADPGGQRPTSPMRTSYVPVRVRRKMMFGMCIKASGFIGEEGQGLSGRDQPGTFLSEQQQQQHHS